MSATGELRRMLDERSVEWRDSSDENVLHTTWNAMKCWFNEFPDGWTAWGMAMRGTPAQAIAATLGDDGLERSNDGVSRYAELFGTPERAARTITRMQMATDLMGVCDADTCPAAFDECWKLDACPMDDYDALIEWLRGDA